MKRPVTLRGRTQVTALLQRLEQAADQHVPARGLDRRNRRTWRQALLGVWSTHSLRLLALGRVLAPQRRAQSVKAAAQGLAYFLAKAQFPHAAVSTAVLEAAVGQIDPAQLVLYHGKALVAVDPTEYGKRSRGRGTKGRGMAHIGRVRCTTTKKKKPAKKHQAARRTTPAAPPAKAVTAPQVATTYGYVDVWAGLVLQGKQLLPLARQLFSSAHPTVTSQNRVEEAVLAQALGLLQRRGLAAIALGDRGLGRKELIVRLAREEQDFVFRVDADILVYRPAQDDGQLLADALAAQPWRGEADWDRGEEGVLRCRMRTLRARVRFSRSGRKDDVQEATVNFVQLVPLAGTINPLLLVTTLPVDTRAQARAIARLYAQRWAIEVAFETMHAWGQERFMVRAWTAIDRLLWILAVAYALLVLVHRLPRLRRFRDQAVALLTQLSVVGAHLTVGKLAEAISLDYARHARPWTSNWLL